MSLRARFNLLFILLLGGLLVSLLGIRHIQSRQRDQLAVSERAERRTLLQELLALHSVSSRHFVEDYGQWDETVGFIAAPTEEFAKDNWIAGLDSFRLDRIWVFKADASLIYSTAAPAGSPAPPAPLPLATLRQLFAQPFVRFFLRDATGVFEVTGASVVPTADHERTTVPVGYLLIAQQLNDEVLKRLTPIAQGTLGLRRVDEPASSDPFSTSSPLLDHTGTPVAHLTLLFSLPEASLLATTDALELAAAAAIGLTGLLVLGLCLHLWIFQPLSRITDSLATNELSPILPLFREPTELGRLAALVRQSHQQQVLLRQVHDDRARLSRDLHDGAIQAIYATGLSLASVRALLHSSPAAAEALLEKARLNLNDVIRDLRTSITGLEPPPQPDRTFSQLLAPIFGLAPTSLTLATHIDDVLADRLTLSQRAQLLPIVREALSNATRHALARTLRITLRSEAAGALLEISDDGIGFDPAVPRPGGHGLANLAARARDLGATYTLKSAPGAGTTLSFLLPLSP